MEENQVTLAEILQAREERVRRQKRILEAHGLPLISFTMNIPGPLKRNELIERAFYLGISRVEDALALRRRQVATREEVLTDAGCEAIWAVDAPADMLKEWMTAIEEADELGRLFDLDVLDAQGRKLNRQTQRCCLICGAPAYICARSRSHPIQMLYERSQQIIRRHFEESRASAIGACAERALLYESLVTPKPGLVDRANNGAHEDMDIFSFASSASALRNWFEFCARTGMEEKSHSAAFDRMRVRAAEAEREMRAFTGGANTHKGALFSLGILCCAVGMVPEGAKVEEILQEAAPLAKPSLHQLRYLTRESDLSGGEEQYLLYGLTGARGEAAEGFPHVRDLALPALKRAAERGKSANEAGLMALAALMPRVQDSNILRRRGKKGLAWMQNCVQELGNRPTIEEFKALDAAFIRENISPGGSADLLAAAFFLYFVTGGTFAQGG